MRIGYGRVSTRDQNPDAQHEALEAAGCERVFIDTGQRQARFGPPARHRAAGRPTRRRAEIVLPLMLASVLADLVAARMLGLDSLLAEKLTRSMHVTTDYEADVLRTTTVAEVMTTPVQTLPAGIRMADAVQRLAGPHSAYPLMDGNRCVGMVTRTDVLREDAADDECVESSDPRDVVAVAPHDPVLTALQRMLDEAVDHLPVLDGDGGLVGICTRTDVLRARHRHFASDQRERGWLSPRARRSSARRDSDGVQE